MMEFFFWEETYLNDLLEREREAYRAAKPFPHAVVDGFLPEAAAVKASESFPGLGEARWTMTSAASDVRPGKSSSMDESDFKPFMRHLLSQLNSHAMLKFLEELTGIEGLLPDPETGRSLRHFGRGGFLEVHADFNYHKRLKLHRRINLILYLNREWKAEWGGALELWEPDMTSCTRRILPEFNRAIIFPIRDDAPHGFPQPLSCPPEETRMSVNMYYYTVEASEDSGKASAATRFKKRPQTASKATGKARFKKLALDWVPPVLFRLAGRLRRRKRRC